MREKKVAYPSCSILFEKYSCEDTRTTITNPNSASTLFVSERTLKRRLQEEDASFQSLVDQVRLDRARDLLGSTGMNLSQIADALGYADAANFTRAFKRWTGLSPSHYRTRANELLESA